MPRASDAPLEKRESRFDGVSVNVAMHIFPRVVDSSVFFAAHRTESERIDGRFVRDNDFRVPTNVIVNDFADGIGFRIFGMDEPQIAIALANANHNLLIGARAVLAWLADDIGLVNFNRAAKFLGLDFHHGRTNPMREVPRSFVGHFQHSLKLVRRHALARFTEQIGRKKPLPERQVRVMKDRASRGRELIAAPIAIELVPCNDVGDFLGATRRAGNSLGPAKPFEISATFFFATELFNKRAEV